MKLWKAVTTNVLVLMEMAEQISPQELRATATAGKKRPHLNAQLEAGADLNDQLDTGMPRGCAFTWTSVLI